MNEWDKPSVKPDLVEKAITSPDLVELLQNDVVVGLLSDVHLTRLQWSMLNLEMIIVIVIVIVIGMGKGERNEIHLRSLVRH